MKINEILAEAGFWKGVAQAIAPNTVARSDQAKNARPGLDQILDQNDTGTFEYEGETYTWLGGMWGLQNPATGKFVPAPKDMQDQLNIASGSKNAAPLAGTLNKTPNIPAEVTTPTGIKVKKNQVTGKWYRQDNKKPVTDPYEIGRLEQLAKNAQQVNIARGIQTR
jgi:hypothetical protein